jgi:hypothetical protein
MSCNTVFSRLDDDQWNMLVSTSPQASPFNRREFLESLGTRSVRFGIMKDDRVLAGVAVQLDSNNVPIGPPATFGYYQGIMLSPSFESMPEHSRNRIEVETTEKLLAGLTAKYHDLWLGLHWRFRDLRPLQWLSYHLPQQGQFQLALRYTGILDLSSFVSIDAYIDTLGRGRRGDYRKALNHGIVVSRSDDLGILDSLHCLTFSRQNADRGSFEHQLKPMARAALQHGFGELLVAYIPSGDPISASLFIWDRTTSHYLFGASDPEWRETGAATLVIVESIAQAMRRNIRYIDFVGINSPQRGNFKTSFNAVPVPYFDAHWRRPDF